MPKLIRIITIPISFIDLLKGQLKFMSQNGFEVIGVSSPGEELQKVKKIEGVRTIAIPMTRTISPFADLRALWQLYRIFKNEKPDIVHSHTPKAGILAMLAAYLAREVPIRLHTVAGLPLLEAGGVKRKLLDVVEKTTYACATKIYPNSYGLKEIILQNNYTKKEKLKVIGYGSSNGIDTSEFDPKLVSKETCLQLRKDLNIKKDEFIFLFIGRLVTDKGLNELVEAFILLQERQSNIHLVIVGSNERDLDPLLPQTEKNIETNPNIHAVGYKNNVIDYFAFADVLTFPSYREGFPNVVMQAAAMQLNSIVSDINGGNEIITNGENGWIVSVKNVNELQNRMQWCLENKERSKKMGFKSRKLMQEKYERSFIWSELLKEYEELLSVDKLIEQKTLPQV